MSRTIKNIPASVSFVDTLAEKVLLQYENNEFNLADVVILVANRREAGCLKEAFVRKQGLKPTILPKIVPIGDLEEDEIFLTSENAESSFLPAISNTERLLLFTKIIVSKPGDFGLTEFSLSQAFSLAKELASLVDTVQNEHLNFDDLKNLVPEEYSVHWQETLKFLRIITSYWPQILRERNFLDVAEKHNLLLKLKKEQWQRENPQTHIIAAGIYADYPEVKDLLKTIYELPNGEIYIGGLDRNLDEESWKNVAEAHPQYQLKRLLEYLEITRDDVKDCIKSQNSEKERFVSEVMRPAKTTDKWLELKDFPFNRESLEGLRLVECDNLQQEALVVAMIMRSWIEEKEVTAAMISPDRNLSRMVAAELKRWGIGVDDTAGTPLNRQPTSIYLRQIISVIEQNFSSVSMLSLLKNPFCRCGDDIFEFRKKVRDYETYVLREKDNDSHKDLELWPDAIKEKIKPLTELFLKKKADLKTLIRTHLEISELLADSSEGQGAKLLWKGESGRICAEFFADLLEYAGIIGEIKTEDYSDFIENMMAGVSVRKIYGTHPRLKIMGPVEARLNNYDLVIIAGANEGVWPPISTADPWMSRSMKYKFGLPLPEKQSGIFAFDFANLLAQRNVYITRSKRVDGAPANKSRWWLRLETVLQAAGEKIGNIYENEYVLWAKLLDKSGEKKKIEAPKPCPSLNLRPRKLSASGLSALIDNPYVAYAKYILKLYPLKNVEAELNTVDFGNIVHKVLELFCRQYPKEQPFDAKSILYELGKKVFAENGVDENKMIFWKPRFEKMIDWFLSVDQEERRGIKNIIPEEDGEMTINLPAGDFVLTSRADRIDEYDDGSMAIVDYKTGSSVPSLKAVKSYKAPQLILEALIAEAGGFENISSNKVSSMKYWKLGEKVMEIQGKELEDLLAGGERRVKEILHKYDFETVPYEVNPAPKYCKNNDYEHLSRIAEWGVNAKEDEEFDDE